MRQPHYPFAMLFALLCFAPLRADTVVLTNGKTLEGRVTRDGDTIVIEMPQGQVRIARDKVRTINPKRTPLDEFAEKRQQIQQELSTGKIQPVEAAARWYGVAVWAGELNLTRARDEALKSTLALDTDHAEARRASGYYQLDGKWMTFAERNHALGFVLFEGRWVPPEAVEHVKRLRNR